MPMKGLLKFFTTNKTNHHHSSSPKSQKTFSTTLMEENILSAELIISKWNLASPQSKINTLFYDTREEADEYCLAVHDLQRAMVFFTSNECTESTKSKSTYLIHAQSLMQTAMKRLEKEFYQILSANRDKLDPDSVSHRSARSSISASISDLDSEDDTRTVYDTISEVQQASAIAMADLRTIAQTMISAGYGKECVEIYNMIRKSIVDEGMYRLGFENLTLSQIKKLDWEVLDLKIRAWLSGSGIVIRTLLSGERILCDHVFEGSDSIRESCFAEITKEAATCFLLFPELVAKSKGTSEKLFRVLDLLNSLSDIWTDIEYVFSFDTTASVRSQAFTTFLKLGEAVRFIISEFEMGIRKDGSKNLSPGGGIHPLTRYAMNYLVHLSDYELALSDICADFCIQTLLPLPESFFDSSTVSSPLSYDSTPSPVPIKIAWLILVLLCKLDGKAELYKEVPLAYLFLANNLQYIVERVKESKLRQILGEDWIFKHESKVKHYASGYERLGWARVASLIPVSETPETAAEKITHFYAAFEEAIRVQKEWIVEDENMKEETRELVADIIVPTYRVFYDIYHPIFCDDASGGVAIVRYAPEDVRTKLTELFSGSTGSDSGYGSKISRSNRGDGFDPSIGSNETY